MSWDLWDELEFQQVFFECVNGFGRKGAGQEIVHPFPLLAGADPLPPGFVAEGHVLDTFGMALGQVVGFAGI